MMKAKDCAVATALVIQGFLRANDEGDDRPQVQNKLLAEAIGAIRQECDDWAENLPSEVNPTPPALNERQQSLVDLANDLAATIDAATDRPTAELEQWNALCDVLRTMDVAVEDVVTAPANWS